MRVLDSDNGEIPSRTGCKSRRTNGKPCLAVAVLDSGYCAVHDPDRREQMREQASRAGRQRSHANRLEKLIPATLRPVLDLLLNALRETYEGDLDPNQARAVSSIAAAIVKVYSSATLEERLAELEAKLAELTNPNAPQPSPESEPLAELEPQREQAA